MFPWSNPKCYCNVPKCLVYLFEKTVGERKNAYTRIFPDVITEDLDYKYKQILNSDNPVKWAKTIVCYANGRVGVMFVGLELTLHETEDALRLSGLGYDNSNDTDYAYMYLLSAFHGCSIDECNVVLEKRNVKPLGTKSKK